ncbi:MAG TPA: AI-2E family transporter, partial [Candidatus Angelobacter sp.]|nr:AI-2E family transporter [Candidatus Angelobacter sp.]
MKFFDRKTAQALFTTLIFVLVLLFLYVAWRAIITFLFAIFFAYILEAPVSKFQTWLKGSRPLAIAVVYVVFAGVLVLLFAMVGSTVIDEAQKLTQQAPEFIQKVSSGSLVKQLADKHGWNTTMVEWVRQYL